VRSALPAPVDVYVGYEFLEADGVGFDAAALRVEFDDRSIGGAADLAARVQRAASALGQQGEVVGIEAERKVQCTRGAELAIDGETGIPGTETQSFEGPVLPLQDHAAAAVGAIAAQLAAEIAECEVEIAIAAKGSAAGLHVEVERPVEARAQLRGIEFADVALERPALLRAPARETRKLRLAAKSAEIERVDLQVILVQFAAQRDLHRIELRDVEITVGLDGVRPQALEAVLSGGAREDLRRFSGEARHQRPAQSTPVPVQQ